MVIFHRFLYVYQAGYQSRYLRFSSKNGEKDLIVLRQKWPQLHGSPGLIISQAWANDFHLGVSWNGDIPRLDGLDGKSQSKMDENWGYLHFRKFAGVESVIPFGEFHMHKYPTGQQRLLVEVRVDKEHVRANSNNHEDTETHPETLKGTYLGKL